MTIRSRYLRVLSELPDERLCERLNERERREALYDDAPFATERGSLQASPKFRLSHSDYFNFTFLNASACWRMPTSAANRSMLEAPKNPSIPVVCSKI